MYTHKLTPRATSGEPMQFHNIAIIGQPQKITGHNDTIQRLYDYLKSLGLNAYVE